MEEQGAAAASVDVRNAKKRKLTVGSSTQQEPTQLRKEHEVSGGSQTTTTAGQQASLLQRAPSFEEPPVELEAVVLHPGSHSLKLGLATDDLPCVVPHFIARRINNKEDGLPMARTEFDQASGEQRAALDQARTAGFAAVMSEVPLKRKSLVEDVERFGPHNCTETVTWADDFVWTQIDHQPPFLVGADAQNVGKGRGYRLQRPLARGRFNIQEGYTMRMVVDDLHAIWEHALLHELGLTLSSKRDFSQYVAVLIVADLFDRRQVREMLNLLVHTMGFAGVMVLQESVCTAFGYGLASACVVDIGDQKTTITCVDEGACVPDSRIVLNYGGRDIADWLLWVVKHWGRHHFPYSEASALDPLDEQFLHDLKKECCHLHQEEQTTQIFSFYERRPAQRTLLHHININQELIFAPLGLFHPTVLSLGLAPSSGEPLAPFADAIIDHDILPEATPARGHQATTRPTSTKQDGSKGSDRTGELTDERSLLPLHEAVVAAIAAIPANKREQRKRMCSAVVLAGGSSQFPGLREALEVKINDAAPASWAQDDVGETSGAANQRVVEVLASRRKDMELDSRFLSWKGGAIAACLEATREFWVTAAQWRAHGERHLRERAAFLW